MYNEDDGPFFIRHVVQSMIYIKYGDGVGLDTMFIKEPKNSLDISVDRAVENERKVHRFKHHNVVHSLSPHYGNGQLDLWSPSGSRELIELSQGNGLSNISIAL
jgi:hypothetical protein